MFLVIILTTGILWAQPAGQPVEKRIALIIQNPLSDGKPREATTGFMLMDLNSGVIIAGGRVVF